LPSHEMEGAGRLSRQDRDDLPDAVAGYDDNSGSGRDLHHNQCGHAEDYQEKNGGVNEYIIRYRGILRVALTPGFMFCGR